MDDMAPSAVIPVWPGGAPGSEGWSQVEQEGFTLPPPGVRIVRNVTQPTLTAFLPDPAIATGTAVVICPGGGYHFLAYDHEGLQVARWLARRGVAGFILKYRLVPTAEKEEDSWKQMQAAFSRRNVIRDLLRQYGPLFVADGKQAVKVVRQQAGKWGIAPDRIGIMGFSAGGYVTTGVALQFDEESRPNFAAPIYPAPFEKLAVPPDAPPLFLALANNDEMAVHSCLGLQKAWKRAGLPVEMHMFSQGGHGFGMNKLGLPVDGWIDLFAGWLQAQGFAKRPG